MNTTIAQNPALWRRLVSLPARQIRWKVILPYVALVTILAGVGTFVATTQVQGSLDERFENQLVDAGRTANDSLVRREEAHLTVARSVAFTQGLPDAIADGDETFASSLALNIAANTGTERIEIVNSTGARVAGVQVVDADDLTYGSTSGTDDPRSWPLVTQVLADAEGRKLAQIIQTSSGTFLMTASPVSDGSRRVGAVVVGTTLDTIAAQMQSEALADINLYDFDGNLIATTFVLDDASQLAAPAQINSVSEGQVARQSRLVTGRQYDLLYGQLLLSGQPVGYYSAALPSDFIFDAGRNAAWQMALLFGLGMVVVLVIGLMVAGSISRRIGALTVTAERITAGDMTARTEVKSEDELGRLATSINLMTDRIEGQYMATMRSLASAVAGRNAYTLRHSRRVGELAVMLGRELGLEEMALAQLEIGGYLHDVGKVGVRDMKMKVPGAFTVEQVQTLGSHPHIGVDVPEAEGVERQVREFIGSGGQANGNDSRLTIVDRLVAVADAYDALTADRPDTGSPLTAAEALEVMRAGASVRIFHFGTVEALARLVPDWERSQGRGSNVREIAELEAIS